MKKVLEGFTADYLLKSFRFDPFSAGRLNLPLIVKEPKGDLKTKVSITLEVKCLKECGKK